MRYRARGTSRTVLAGRLGGPRYLLASVRTQVPMYYGYRTEYGVLTRQWKTDLTSLTSHWSSSSSVVLPFPGISLTLRRQGSTRCRGDLVAAVATGTFLRSCRAGCSVWVDEDDEGGWGGEGGTSGWRTSRSVFLARVLLPACPLGLTLCER